MPKEIKKCYDYLDLNYNSTKEEINSKYYQVLGKISKKHSKNKIKYEKSLKKLEYNYNLIKNYIEKFGTPEEKRTNISVTEILTQTFALVLVVYIVIKLILSLT